MLERWEGGRQGHPECLCQAWRPHLFGYGSIPMKIPFLVGWTSILTQLFWCEQKGYKVLTHCHLLLQIPVVKNCFQGFSWLNSSYFLVRSSEIYAWKNRSEPSEFRSGFFVDLCGARNGRTPNKMAVMWIWWKPWLAWMFCRGHWKTLGWQAASKKWYLEETMRMFKKHQEISLSLSLGIYIHIYIYIHMLHSTYSKHLHRSMMSTQKICTAAHRIASRPASQVARPASAFESGVSRILALDSEVPGGSDFFGVHTSWKRHGFDCVCGLHPWSRRTTTGNSCESHQSTAKDIHILDIQTQSSRCQEEFQSNWSGKIMWFCKGCVTWMASSIRLRDSIFCDAGHNPRLCGP